MIIQLELEAIHNDTVHEFLSWIARDSSNQELCREMTGIRSGDGSSFMEYDYKYTFDKPIKSPVRFMISDYPNKIEKEFEVNILQ
jgi:hypothetical protein